MFKYYFITTELGRDPNSRLLFRRLLIVEESYSKMLRRLASVRRFTHKRRRRECIYCIDIPPLIDKNLAELAFHSQCIAERVWLIDDVSSGKLKDSVLYEEPNTGSYLINTKNDGKIIMPEIGLI